MASEQSEAARERDEATSHPAVRVRRKPGTRQIERADSEAARAKNEVPELHTPFDEVPPEENNPRRREHATVGFVELTEEGREHVTGPLPEPPPLDIPGAGYEIPDASDKIFRTLEDIMGAFPIGTEDGQYFVHVMRTHPATFMGQTMKGILRKIHHRLTLEEFRDQYGGGVYDLIVYGPPKRGGLPDEITGLVRPKALTKPIRITIPYHINGGYPPILLLDDEEDEEGQDDMMRGSHLPFGIPPRSATPAAAQIVNHQLRHDEEMDQRERAERRERQRERQNRESSALDVLARQHEASMAALQEQNRELREEIKQQARRKPESDLEGVGKLVERLNPKTSSEELQSLRDGHQREVDRLTQMHKQELDAINRRHSDDRSRVDEQHRGEVERIEARVAEATRRADDRVRDVETRLERSQEQGRTELTRQKQELDAAHDRELTFTRNQAERDLAAQKANYESLLASERRTAEREIQTNKEIATSQLTTEKRSLELEMRALKSELARRDTELAEIKKVAEKNKDLSRLLEEAKRTADLLGYGPKEEGGAEAPADWKSMVMTVLPKLPELLPQILQSAGGAIAAARGTQPQQRQAQPQPHMVPGLPPYQPNPGFQAPPRRFATEASGMEPVGGPQSFEPQRFMPPPEVPQQPMQRMAPQQPELGPAPQVSFAPPPGAPAPLPSIPPLGSVPPPPMPTATPTPSTPPPGAQAVDPALDATILQGCQELLEPAFAQQQPAAGVAALIVGRFGKDQIRQFLPTFNPENVVGALQRSGASSRLQSRKGRRYLTELQAAIMKELEKT